MVDVFTLGPFLDEEAGKKIKFLLQFAVLFLRKMGDKLLRSVGGISGIFSCIFHGCPAFRQFLASDFEC